MSETILLTETINVPARLMVVPDYGDSRPATPEDLEEAGWIERAGTWRRCTEVFEKIGLDVDSDGAALLRSLIQYASGYYDHDQTPEEWAEYAPIVDAMKVVRL